MRIIRFDDLEPSWDGDQAKEVGFLRWAVTWVRSDTVALGLMGVLPANAQPLRSLPCGVVYVVARARVVATLGEGSERRRLRLPGRAGLPARRARRAARRAQRGRRHGAGRVAVRGRGYGHDPSVAQPAVRPSQSGRLSIPGMSMGG